jgi:hypothetical protein
VLPAPVEVLATNTSDRSIFVPPCIQHQRLSANGSWQGEPNPACAAIDALFLVKPGATDTIGAPFISAPGTYRVVLFWASDSSFGAPFSEAFSNSFTVVQ